VVNDHRLTVTFSRGVVREFVGRHALRQAFDYADAHGLLLHTLSTHRTIARDLRGPHEPPEPRVLRLVGRTDLASDPQGDE